MSKTKRTLRRGYNPEYILKEKGGDAQVRPFRIGKKKLTPYTGKGTFKFVPERTDHVSGYSKSLSKYEKLVTKNANRSMKKKVRQKVKKEILEEIENG